MNRTTITRAVAAALLGTALVASAVPALSQSTGDGGRGYGPRTGQLSEADRAKIRERIEARMNERFDRMAKRLDIKPSQEEAWNGYRKARTPVFGTLPQRPGRDADAATIARFRAELAQRRAQQMLTVADATAKLQDVLDPEQRKVLNEITRRAGARGRHGGFRAAHHHAGQRADAGRA